MTNTHTHFGATIIQLLTFHTKWNWTIRANFTKWSECSSNSIIWFSKSNTFDTIQSHLFINQRFIRQQCCSRNLRHTPNHKQRKTKRNLNWNFNQLSFNMYYNGLYHLGKNSTLYSWYWNCQLEKKTHKHTFAPMLLEYLVRFLYLVISIGGFDEHKIWI